MNSERVVAGIFAGAGALLLIYRGNVTEGSIILASLVAFFIGEKNGQRKISEKEISESG